MKKILTILIFSILSCKAQQVTTILPINEDDYPNGAYLKDLDNLFLPFIGTWEGVKNNKKYTIKLIKFSQKLRDSGNGNYYFRDVVEGDIKVLDIISNSIIYDKLSIINLNELSIFGVSTPNGRNFKFLFTDKDEFCNNEYQFKLQTLANNPNQLKYFDFKLIDDRMMGDCTAYQTREEIPSTLPNGSFILTKQ